MYSRDDLIDLSVDMLKEVLGEISSAYPVEKRFINYRIESYNEDKTIREASVLFRLNMKHRLSGREVKIDLPIVVRGGRIQKPEKFVLAGDRQFYLTDNTFDLLFKNVPTHMVKRIPKNLSQVDRDVW